MFLNSLALVDSIEEYIDKYKYIARNKGKEYMEFFCYDNNTKGVRDLFYQHAVVSNENLYILNAVSMSSNYSRNVIALLKKDTTSKVNSDGKSDVFIEIVLKKLHNLGLNPHKNCNFNSKTDIDIMFEIDDKIFIAECKDILNSTDIFEMRTTINAIKKAEKQLDVIVKAMPQDKKDFLKKNIYNDTKEIVPFILTSGRVMSGNNVFQYPVRALHEFINFIDTGYIDLEQKKYDFGRLINFVLRM